MFRTFVSGGTGDGIRLDATAGSIAPISMSQNDLSGNTGFGLRNDSAQVIVAERNWWGSNLAAGVAAEISGSDDLDPWLASGTDVSGLFGFQPFNYATTSGTITTLLGTGAADTGAVLAGNPVTMMMNGETAFTPLAELLNFDIQLGGGDDTLTLGATGIPTILDMGAGTNDRLLATNVATTFNVTGANGGNSPGVASSFVGVEHLSGGTAADSFVFGAAGTLGGSIDGNLGVDTLNVSAVAGPAVNATGPGTLDGVMGTATPLGSGFDNINLIVGSPADLSVSKSAPASVNAGTNITYTIDVTNAGPNPALDVTLTDPLPPGTTFVSLLSPAGWSCTMPSIGAGGTVTCDRASLPVSTSSFTLTVNAPLATGDVTNTATVASANEGNAGDESDSTTTTLIGVADLVIDKDGPDDALQDSVITYTITVTNNGPLAATNVTATDVLPAGVELVLATPSQGTCSGTTTVTCDLGTLANGASATIALDVRVTATGGTITNAATVDADEVDPTPANSSSTTANAFASAAIPSLSMLGLFALAAMLALVATMRS